MLFGLAGAAGAGKDTVYALATVMYPNVVRRSFAGKLYASAAAALGVTPADLERWKRKGTKIKVSGEGGFLYHQLSVREYLQRYGTEAHREVFGPDFWVEQVDLAHEGRMVFVTDVRFPNEAEAIRAAGGHVVWVEGVPDPLGPVAASHASAQALPESLIDAILDNTVRNDNLTNLACELTWLVDEIGGAGR